GGEQFTEPRCIDIEGLAALDTLELDGTQAVAVVLIVTDDAAVPFKCALYGKVGAALDQAQVVRIGGGGAGIVAALLHHHLFGSERLGKLAAEELAGVDGIELNVAKGVARHGFTG